jgi:hypothetical protein
VLAVNIVAAISSKLQSTTALPPKGFIASSVITYFTSSFVIGIPVLGLGTACGAVIGDSCSETGHCDAFSVFGTVELFVYSVEYTW